MCDVTHGMGFIPILCDCDVRFQYVSIQITVTLCEQTCHWHWIIDPKTSDLTSGSPGLAFYWPTLVTKVQRPKNQLTYFKILIILFVKTFCFWPPEFDPGYVTLWVTVPDRPLTTSLPCEETFKASFTRTVYVTVFRTV